MSQLLLFDIKPKSKETPPEVKLPPTPIQRFENIEQIAEKLEIKSFLRLNEIGNWQPLPVQTEIANHLLTALQNQQDQQQKNLVIEAETGGGKTLGAALLAASALADNRPVVFITPTHALVEQTTKEFQKFFNSEKAEIKAVTGELGKAEERLPQYSEKITVATARAFALDINYAISNPDSWQTDLFLGKLKNALVIMDEGHRISYIGSGGKQAGQKLSEAAEYRFIGKQIPELLYGNIALMSGTLAGKKLQSIIKETLKEPKHLKPPSIGREKRLIIHSIDLDPVKEKFLEVIKKLYGNTAKRALYFAKKIGNYDLTNQLLEAKQENTPQGELNIEKTGELSIQQLIGILNTVSKRQPNQNKTKEECELISDLGGLIHLRQLEKNIYRSSNFSLIATSIEKFKVNKSPKYINRLYRQRPDGTNEESWPLLGKAFQDLLKTYLSDLPDDAPEKRTLLQAFAPSPNLYKQALAKIKDPNPKKNKVGREKTKIKTPKCSEENSRDQIDLEKVFARDISRENSRMRALTSELALFIDQQSSNPQAKPPKAIIYTYNVRETFYLAKMLNSYLNAPSQQTTNNDQQQANIRQELFLPFCGLENMSAKERAETIEKFRSRDDIIGLIATNVITEGIDLPQVQRLFCCNFDGIETQEKFAQLIGRVGRGKNDPKQDAHNSSTVTILCCGSKDYWNAKRKIKGYEKQTQPDAGKESGEQPNYNTDQRQRRKSIRQYGHPTLF
ncbi:MAG TPA: DEAD/DEAH box helicase family protein [Oligoflexia bacterium]|nr:DEAD/DEAH box helicase family protein [Oligoflexia bacterium]HMP27492.1 DEAD/DEAH box helicase family protein [Oligoflexia bacterium]